MIKYSVDLGKPHSYYKWVMINAIMYEIRTHGIENDTLDDHLLTIF